MREEGEICWGELGGGGIVAAFILLFVTGYGMLKF